MAKSAVVVHFGENPLNKNVLLSISDKGPSCTTHLSANSASEALISAHEGIIFTSRHLSPPWLSELFHDQTITPLQFCPRVAKVLNLRHKCLAFVQIES